MTWAQISVLKELSGMAVVAFATLWAIYVLFFAKGPKSSTITVNTVDGGFQPGDLLMMNGEKYKVLTVKGEQLTIGKRNWFR